MTHEEYMLVREARWALTRLEEDEDFEALDDAIDMLVDLRETLSSTAETDPTPDPC